MSVETEKREIVRVVESMPTSDGAGVKLRRSIGSPSLDMLDPFLLLDSIASDDAADYIAGFPEHPHRGFETVTYMLEGRMRHKDSTGGEGLLEAGSVQWMTAGRGVVHSEIPEQEEGRLHGFQLWVNLPALRKMTPARYQDIPPKDVPEVDLANGGKVRVVAGTLNAVTGPVAGIDVEPVFLDVSLAAGDAMEVVLPHDHTAFVYCIAGEPLIGGTAVPANHLGVLGVGNAVDLSASAPAHFLLIAGAPINEPVARYGPFVMNTRAELEQAFRDFQSGRFLS